MKTPARRRSIVALVLALLPVYGCVQAGPDAAWAQQAVPDTVEARRVDFPRPPRYLSISGPSPDGRLLAGQEAENGDLIVASIDGEVRKLAPTSRTEPWEEPGFAENARFSRDGRRITYLWWDYPGEPRNGDGQVRVVEASGGEPWVIYDTPDFDYALPMDWSPDGSWVAVSARMPDRTWQILVVPADGGEPRLVRALDWRAPNAVGFSQDGRYLAYDLAVRDDSHARDVFVYDLESGRERSVLDHSANDLLLGWSPDGSLLFQSDRSGTPGAWRVEMREGRPVGEPVLVKPEFWRAFGMGFTASGDFYYAVETGGPVVYSVALDPRTGLADGAPRALTAPGESSGAAVTPDARLLAFQQRGGDGRSGVALTLRGLEGGESRNLDLPTRINRLNGHRWLPDGSGVLFAGQENGRDGFFRVDARSGDVRRLLDADKIGGGSSQFVFDVTPDGRQLVYRGDARPVPIGSGLSPRAEQIVVRELDSGEERILTSFEWPDFGLPRAIAISPDGRSIAYWRPRAVSGDSPVADLVVAPLTGGEGRVIPGAVGGGITWTADGQALLMNKPGTGLVRVPLDGSPPVAIGVQGGALRVDPSGDRLIFQRQEGGDRGFAFELWQLRLGRRP